MDATSRLVDTLAATLSRRGEILEAYLFGSRARGEAAAHSDVDVALYVSAVPDAPFGYEAEIASDLMKALGAKHVDVVLLNRATPLLYHRVLRDGRRILSRDLAATTAREGQALSRYCDYVPQLAKIDRAISERIRRREFGR